MTASAARVRAARGSGLASRLPALGLFVLIIGLSLFLVDLLKRRAQGALCFRVDPSLIEVGELPGYVPERVGDELRALTFIEPRSIFDARLVPDVKASLARHPWVRDVRGARRVLPNRLVLDIEMRAPAALVEVATWRLTVDRDGFVLEDHPSQAPEGLPRVRGDKRAIPQIPRIGTAFESRAVAEGLAVLRDLRQNAEHPVFRVIGIVALDVSGVARESGSEVVIELANGTLVDWGGSSAGALGPLEVPAARKLDNLKIACDKHPGLHGVTRVDVRAQTPFVTVAP